MQLHNVLQKLRELEGKSPEVSRAINTVNKLNMVREDDDGTGAPTPKKSKWPFGEMDKAESKKQPTPASNANDGRGQTADSSAFESPDKNSRERAQDEDAESCSALQKLIADLVKSHGAPNPDKVAQAICKELEDEGYTIEKDDVEEWNTPSDDDDDDTSSSDDNSEDYDDSAEEDNSESNSDEDDDSSENPFAKKQVTESRSLLRRRAVKEALTITADGAEAQELARLLVNAGIGSSNLSNTLAIAPPIGATTYNDSDMTFGGAPASATSPSYDNNYGQEEMVVDSSTTAPHPSTCQCTECMAQTMESFRSDDHSEWANAPNQHEETIDTQLKTMSGGPNNPKTMYKKEYPGDNAMTAAMKENWEMINKKAEAELEGKLTEGLKKFKEQAAKKSMKAKKKK